MTNNNTIKMLSNSTEVHSSCTNQVQNQKCHSRVVKSSVYYQSSVTPSRGRRQTENSSDTSDKKMKAKPLGMNSRTSPSNVRQGSLNAKQQRTSPSKERSASTSPTLGCYYAGAKFSEPPTPKALPKPPSHWTSFRMTSGGAFPLLASGRADNCHGLSNLKMLLNVPA